MEPEIDAATRTARVLGCLAQLQHRGDPHDHDELAALRPAWMRLDAWDLLLQDLERECYRDPRDGAPGPGPVTTPARSRCVLAIVR